MGQQLRIKPRGLYTHPNQLSEVPEGALLTAENVVMDKESQAETRRGFSKYGTPFTLGMGDQFNKFTNFKDRILVHYASKLSRDSDGLGTWMDYTGSYDPPSGADKINFFESNQNLYLTTSTGIKKLDTLTSTPVAAGAPKALDGVGVTTGIAGFMTNNTQVAYRIVFGIRDANNNLILGAPSQRIIVVNSSGGTRNVSLTFSLPASITTDFFYQIYRSAMSAGVAIDPNDELQLVFEKNPTAGEVAALAVTFTDITPESLRGATLYTSPSQQGIAEANDQPPLAQDIATYKGHAIYVNTTSKQRYFLTLISVGGTGLVVNDTIKIGTTTYTGKAVENVAVGDFLVDTAGTPADNIENTALSLVRTINRFTTNTVYYAYYISGFNDLPGQILIEERSLGGAAYPIISNRGNAFNPVLPVAGTDQSSSNDRKMNGIYIAKPFQPEAVPIKNLFQAGSADKEITKVVALRDSVFFFKQDGIFRLTGEDLISFRIILFDNTAVLGAAETAKPFSNRVYCYTSQGVTSVSDNGVEVLSRPIENQLLPLAALVNFPTVSFGFSYESDRKYILSVPDTVDDSNAKKQYVFNLFTDSWTVFLINMSAGFVNSTDDKIYYGDPAVGYVYKERKNFNISDYADEEIPVVVTGSASLIVSLVSTAGLFAGYTLKQSTRETTILNIVNATDLIVSDDSLAWVAGAATVYKPIPVAVRMVPASGGNPGIMKIIREAEFYFRQAQFVSINAGFGSNFSTEPEYIEIFPTTSGPWGLFGWGSVAWGGGVPLLQPIRTYVPREKMRCHWLDVYLTHNRALSVMSFSGVNLVMEPMSERFK